MDSISALLAQHMCSGGRIPVADARALDDAAESVGLQLPAACEHSRLLPSSSVIEDSKVWDIPSGAIPSILAEYCDALQSNAEHAHALTVLAKYFAAAAAAIAASASNEGGDEEEGGDDDNDEDEDDSPSWSGRLYYRKLSSVLASQDPNCEIVFDGITLEASLVASVDIAAGEFFTIQG